MIIENREMLLDVVRLVKEINAENQRRVRTEAFKVPSKINLVRSPTYLTGIRTVTSIIQNSEGPVTFPTHLNHLIVDAIGYV